MLSPKTLETNFIQQSNSGIATVHRQYSPPDNQQLQQHPHHQPGQFQYENQPQPPNFHFMPYQQPVQMPLQMSINNNQQQSFIQQGSMASPASGTPTLQEMGQIHQQQAPPMVMQTNGFAPMSQAQMFYQNSNPLSSTSFANYTTNAVPQPALSSNNSFSMPSEQQQAYYGMEQNNISPTPSQNMHMSGSLPNLVAFQQSPAYEEDRKFSYEVQRNMAPTSMPPQAVQVLMSQAQPQGTHALSYHNPSQNQIQNSNQVTIQDYPQPVAPVAIENSTNTFQNSAQYASFNRIIQARNRSVEDLPFPGVLNPKDRQQPYNPVYPVQQRSATYPAESPGTTTVKSDRCNTNKKHGSYSGMSRETAARNRCDICGKQFKRPSSLQTHKYSHSGEKPFECDWKNCSKVFSVRSNMIRHRKLHVRDELHAGRLPLVVTNPSATNTEEKTDLEQSTVKDQREDEEGFSNV